MKLRLKFNSGKQVNKVFITAAVCILLISIFPVGHAVSQEGRGNNISLVQAADEVEQEQGRRLDVDLLVVGGLLIMGFYHLGLFVFQPEDSAPLYFSLFCFLISPGLSVIENNYLVEYFNLSFDSDYRILLSYYLAVPFFCSFLASLYPDEFSKKLLAASYILGISCCLFSFSGPTEFTLIIHFYKVIILFFAGYSLYTMTAAFFKARPGALLSLSSFLIFFLFAANDILYFNGIMNTGYFLNFGLFIFVLLQSLFLFYRFKEDFLQMRAEVEELQQKNKLLVRDEKFKREFIIDIFQKIKLPINTVVSLTESIIRSGFSLFQGKENLRAIIRTGTGLNHMLDSFTDYFDFKQDKVEVDRQKLEVYEIVDYIINFFSPFVADKNIKFRNDIKQNQFIVVADKSYLIQLFYNILDEICCFMEEAVISFKAKKEKEKIKLILEIKADNILFKYYNKEEKRRSEVEFITGKSNIKQDIIQELIDLQDGDLKIKREANKLLEIIVTLPAGDEPDFYEGKIKETSKSAGDKTKKVQPVRENNLGAAENYILVVGGQSREFNSVVDILNREDYCVKLAEEKEEIEKRLNDNLVLVILDLFALDKRALELSQGIRDRFQLFELPILGMFSRSKLENLTKGFEVGINDFIKKPFEVNELKARVRTLITLKQKVEEGFRREQDFLRAQINPHFLYNALDTIAFLCQKNPEEASDLILDLANYLRYSFDFESLSRVVSISKELELVNFYITIQQARFQKKVNVNYNIKADLTFGIPPLTLQAIVENAIKHGILKQEGGGAVEIMIEKSKEWFIIKVSDNGVGMTERELDNLFIEVDDRRQKIGLKNVNQRLKKLYNQELKIESSKDEGTTVEFKIPT